MSDTGNIIRTLRKSKGWTQKELADAINVSSQVVSNWERGYSNPDNDDVANLAKLFNVSSDVILFGRNMQLTDKVAIELKELLDSFDVQIKGVELTEEDKERLYDVVLGIFWEKLRSKN